MKRKTIGIHPSCDLLDPAIRDALERIEPVQFASCPEIAECREGDAVISFGADAALRAMARRGLQWFQVATATERSRPAAGDGRIRFADSRRVDRRLRGRSLAHRPVPDVAGVRPEDGDEVLAWHGREPVWIARPAAGAWANIVSLPLPKLGRRERLSDYLNEEHFIQALPLVHFLRQATADMGRQQPPLRACLMFDDPNLHRPSYGFLPYEELARRAKACGFHVALATVPLDAWVVHRRAAGVFRDNPAHLSLLIHGNDHVKAELGRARPAEGTLRLVAQGLRRIARLEQTTGLHVARVMAPPHGAYTDASLAAMASLGFEGACISRASLRRGNPGRDWPAAFGLEMAEMMGQLPVLHRFRLSSSCEGHIVMAAFLGRPIIPVGHHDSVAGGLDLLSSIANVVNSLGDVRWTNPERMLRSNYLGVRDMRTLWVTPYSSRMQLTVPPGITALAIDGPRDRCGEFTLRRGVSQSIRPWAGVPVGVAPGDRIEFVSSELGKIDFREVQRPAFSAWALPRRILCEGRDRLWPFLSQVGRRENAE